MSNVVTIARQWIGTPYQHQASCLGAGCDCLGLLRGIWRELYGAEPEVIPAYTPDWSETDGVERLMEGAKRHLAVCDSAQTGDVLLFRMRRGSVAKHLAVISETGEFPKIIHAYSGRGVVESPLTPSWQRRIAGVYRFREV